MIRPAEPADYDEIADMLREFHAAAGGDYTQFDRGSALKTVAHLATLDIGVVFVADGEADSGLIGVIAAVVVPVFVNFAQPMAQESFWWVRPAARRTGAGFALLEHLEQWAVMRGAKTLTMVSWHGSEHERVNALYRDRGYRPFEYHYIKTLPCATR